MGEGKTVTGSRAKEIEAVCPSGECLTGYSRVSEYRLDTPIRLRIECEVVEVVVIEQDSVALWSAMWIPASMVQNE
jgi:hypothetical protein